jgi:hypothetical protein
MLYVTPKRLAPSEIHGITTRKIGVRTSILARLFGSIVKLIR